MTLDYHQNDDDADDQDNFLSRFRASLRDCGVEPTDSLDHLTDAFVDATLDGLGFEKDLTDLPWEDINPDFDI